MRKQLFAASVMLTLLPVAALADPCDDLAGMYAKMGAATSYRETDVAPGGPTIKKEFVAPDRTHDDAAGHESITIGNKVWARYGGHWYADEGRPFRTQSDIWKSSAQDGTLLNNCRTATVLDLGIVNGFHVYHMDAPKFGVQNVMYLQADSLPAKIETTTRGKTFVKTYEWNIPITIEPPQ